MARNRAPRTVAVDVDAQQPKRPKRLMWPWWIVAVAGPLVVLAVGWVLLAAAATVGWLTTPEADYGAAIRLATSILLLAHGATVQIAGLSVSIAPLGLTALLVFLALPVSSLAARQAAADTQDPDDTGALLVDSEAIAWKVGGTFGGVYAALLIVLGAALDALSPGLAIGAFVVGAITGLWGASRGVSYDPTASWPEWLRALPRAVGAALLVVIAGAGAALVVALWSGRARITDIVIALEPGTAGTVLLAVIHLLYLPNLVLACASWVLGAGITLGDDTLISVVTSDVGILPSIPVLGAVPSAGPMASIQVAWLAVGVVAGLLAGAAVAWARPRARFDETSLVGALAGVLTGALLAVACALASGGLGSGRLAEMGARLPEVFVFAPTILGLAGLVGGLVVALARREWPTRTRKDGASTDSQTRRTASASADPIDDDGAPA